MVAVHISTIVKKAMRMLGCIKGWSKEFDEFYLFICKSL